MQNPELTLIFISFKLNIICLLINVPSSACEPLHKVDTQPMLHLRVKYLYIQFKLCY